MGVGGHASGPVADLAIVGAGPAGLAAADTAARAGLRVLLLDGAAHPGGQYWRGPDPALGARRPERLHHHRADRARLLAALDAHRRTGAVRFLPGRQVWAVTGEAGAWTVHTTATVPAGTGVGGEGGSDAGLTVLPARALLLAAGAFERQHPFPGWTLPGVLGAGGAQALLKGQLVVPGRRVVVAGTGPLLLAVADSLAAAGVRVPAVVESAGAGDWLRRAGALLRSPDKLVEGARFGLGLARRATRVLTGHAVVAAHGTDRVEAVTVARVDGSGRPVPGTGRRVPCDALAVGHGLLPRLDLAVTLGCAVRTGPDGAPALRVDGRQATDVPGIWAAGETCGVAGVGAALAEGEIAALAVAGRPVPAGALRRRDRQREFADAVATVHRPRPGAVAALPAHTEVCRCEGVTAGEIRTAAADLGGGDVRTVKLLTRAGMGWCQGRTCGPTVAALCGRPPTPDRRPLADPVPLSELAALAPAPAPGPVSVSVPGVARGGDAAS
ncbi:NAD(P)/FAD-dependent oxidoreductase [Streptomyces sp. BI20]|uniref:FAD/NAD(P)-dependent oxidoreductase n=1 Tax=Streptomyces sp. BI20 TaxID=3403460 RepID=UPI003C77B3D1